MRFPAPLSSMIFLALAEALICSPAASAQELRNPSIDPKFSAHAAICNLMWFPIEVAIQADDRWSNRYGDRHHMYQYLKIYGWGSRHRVSPGDCREFFVNSARGDVFTARRVGDPRWSWHSHQPMCALPSSSSYSHFWEQFMDCPSTINPFNPPPGSQCRYNGEEHWRGAWEYCASVGGERHYGNRLTGNSKTWRLGELNAKSKPSEAILREEFRALGIQEAAEVVGATNYYGEQLSELASAAAQAILDARYGEKRLDPITFSKMAPRYLAYIQGVWMEGGQLAQQDVAVELLQRPSGSNEKSWQLSMSATLQGIGVGGGLQGGYGEKTVTLNTEMVVVVRVGGQQELYPKTGDASHSLALVLPDGIVKVSDVTARLTSRMRCEPSRADQALWALFAQGGFVPEQPPKPTCVGRWAPALHLLLLSD